MLSPIKRTVYTTICNGERVNEHGEYEDFTCELLGDYSSVRATAALRRKYQDDTITISNTETTAEKRILSVENFLKYSEPYD